MFRTPPTKKKKSWLLACIQTLIIIRTKINDFRQILDKIKVFHVNAPQSFAFFCARQQRIYQPIINYWRHTQTADKRIQLHVRVATTIITIKNE